MVSDHSKNQNTKFKNSRVECPEPVEGLFYFYILECNNNSLYCGSSSNLAQRITTHNKGKAAEWTEIRRPVQLFYFETYDTLLDARQRKLQFKGWVRTKKENLIKGVWKKQI